MDEIKRDEKGRFAEGTDSPNPGGSSPARIAYRRALEESVTEEDFKKVVGVLLDAAKAGKPWAVKEVLDLTVGRDYFLASRQRDDDITEILFKFESTKTSREASAIED